MQKWLPMPVRSGLATTTGPAGLATTTGPAELATATGCATIVSPGLPPRISHQVFLVWIWHGVRHGWLLGDHEAIGVHEATASAQVWAPGIGEETPSSYQAMRPTPGKGVGLPVSVSKLLKRCPQELRNLLQQGQALACAGKVQGWN